MPAKAARDEKVAARITAALTRLLSGSPRDDDLRRRAERGTLKVCVATVCVEAGVGRHLLDDGAGPYAEELGLVIAASPKRGTGEPLRSMLDKARAEKRDAEEKLALSQAYALHLLTRSARLRQDVRRLQEEVDSLRGSGAGEDDVLDRLERLPPRLSRAGTGEGRGRGDQS